MVTADPSGYTPRVAIVTGSANGIGYSIAHRLADDGIDVVITDLVSQSDRINEVVEEIKKKGRKSIGVIADVTSEEDVQALVAKTVEELGSLDIVCTSTMLLFIICPTSIFQMVANAGIGRPSLLVDSELP